MSRLLLGHLPTPLQPCERLGAALGVELWVKRDDATGGPEAGNKIRKLELLLGEALERGCDTLVTCGGVQSNHARAMAVLGARLGLRSVLLLRAPELADDRGGAGIAPAAPHAPLCGNVLIDRLVGAELRVITAASYERRDALMQQVATELRAAGARPYVIPEGGSNGLGALGYVEAMAEVRRQLDQGLAGGKRFDLVVHACGSGGTAAGVALGAARHHVARQVCAMAVCSDARSFEARISGIIADAQSIDPSLGDPVPWRVDDRARGPAYAVADDEQRRLMVRAARLSGLVLDPVYTGKALCGLWSLCEAGELKGRRILFLHTGGLPGLLAQASSFEGLV